MNNRILGIVGASLLLVGMFLPIVSFLGIINFSYFNVITSAPMSLKMTAIPLLLLGIASLVLALQNKYKPLVVTGLVSLAILVFDFIRIKAEISKSAGAAAGAGDDMGNELGSRMADAVTMGWGFYVLAIAAIIVIVAGVMKSQPPAPAYAGGPPPPYPPVG